MIVFLRVHVNDCISTSACKSLYFYEYMLMIVFLQVYVNDCISTSVFLSSICHGTIAHSKTSSETERKSIIDTYNIYICSFL